MQNKSVRSKLAALLALGFLALWGAEALAQEGAGAGEGHGRGRGGDKAGADKPKIKPYDEVITDEAVTRQGLFTTHRIGDKLYYEIPVDKLDRELLWVAQVAETTQGNSYAGMPAGDRVVRWQLHGERVLLRDVRYRIRAETDDPISKAVRSSNLAPIIRALPVKAWGPNKEPVIEVTDLFTKDVAEFSARRTLNAGNMDSKRSFVESIKVFPTNIEVRVLASFEPRRERGGQSGGGRPQRPNQNDFPTSSGLTAMLHHSMVELPEKPMRPRRLDSRVGFFSVRFTDFADDSQHQAEQVRYITRWRLEKKNPSAQLSEPVQPIVFYVGREVPDKWKPYVYAGIEQWQPAFEAAGFKNGIVAKYAPTEQEDPNWDPEDARISTIRWLPAAIKNAFGPHVHDPRTGEILEADVRMYHDVQKLVRDWYFVQAAASDARAQKLPMPDDLVGELIQFVVAHEVGHSLGLPHNMKASASYTIAQLRDAAWTKKNGTAPSIMDYARFNYVAQPEDGAGLMPLIGPYDHFSVEWGYSQFPSGVDEKAELEKIVARQVDDPMFRFGGPNPRLDSTQQTEDLGDDAVEATRLGMKNLERISGFLVEATSRRGEDYELLSNMYDQLLGQWIREMGHVVNVVGGVRQDNLYYGDADRRFAPNDDGYQREAVAFLLEQAWTTPAMLTQPDIVLRLTGEGVADRLLATQKRLLAGLVSIDRIDRMAEHAANGAQGYTPAAMLAELRGGLFSELTSRSASADLYRRNLQRAYIEHLGSFLRHRHEGSDLPGLARAELTALSKMTDKVGDGSAMAAHARDLKARIERAFEAEVEDDPAGSGSPFRRAIAHQHEAGCGCFGCPLEQTDVP